MHIIHETERLILRTLNINSAPLVLSFYEDNKLLFEPWEPKRGDNFYTLAYQKASLTAEYNQMTEGKLLRYWVFLKDNPDKIIGSLCFQNIIKGPYQSCTLGYKFSHKNLHKGYAFESINKGIEIIFQDYQLNRIEAFIMPNNEPSLRLITRLSFLYEGLSYSYAKVNGIWSDHKRYSLIKRTASYAEADFMHNT